MRIGPCGRLSSALPALLAYGLAAALGCAGAGKSNTGVAGSSGPGTGGSSGPGTGGGGGSSGPGNGGTTGGGGTTGAGGGGGGSAGSVGPGGGGTSGADGTGAGGTGGTTGSGAGGTSDTGAGGTSDTGTGGTSPAGTGGTGGACQVAQLNYVPKTPTVYLLVDRSGSMFHCLTGNTGDAVCADMTNTAWTKLKTAVESVIAPLDAQVRFGFMTIWGTNPAGQGMCPSLQGMATDNVSPNLNNAAAIKTKYDGLAFPPNSTQVGVKFESPASESIQVASAALQADTTPGDKFILFITDGQPDYCDDSNSLCAPDSVIAQLQVAKAAGVSTIVLGIQTALFDLGTGILQAFANAGAGEPTVAPLRTTTATVNDFYDQCNGIAGWHADLVALGKPNARGTTLGTYSATAGPTTPYMPSATDQTMLVTQLSAALAGVKSCTFDLSDVNGKAIKVDTTRLAQAHVKIQGTEIPLSTTDGWNVDKSAPTTLVFSGSACTTWRLPSSTTIDLQFPCGTIIFE